MDGSVKCSEASEVNFNCRLTKYSQVSKHFVLHFNVYKSGTWSAENSHGHLSAPKLYVVSDFRSLHCWYQAGLLNHSDVSPLQTNIGTKKYMRGRNEKVDKCLSALPEVRGNQFFLEDHQDPMERGNDKI